MKPSITNAIITALKNKKDYFQKYYDTRKNKSDEDENLNQATQLALDDAIDVVQSITSDYAEHVITLPVSVNDYIYIPNRNGRIDRHPILQINICWNNIYFYYTATKSFTIQDINKTVFLTPEAALSVKYNKDWHKIKNGTGYPSESCDVIIKLDNGNEFPERFLSPECAFTGNIPQNKIVAWKLNCKE